MSQTSCERCGFPVPIRWRRAGGDLARPNHVDQCAERPSMRSGPPPRCLSHAPDLACVQTGSSHPARVTSTIEVGAAIKSP
ncbi:MAG TPA: hypothetical protein VLD66_07160 [Methyloceanibacter sp.]|nr:hypothetical protein [Methyloceanibacter sp.]